MLLTSYFLIHDFIENKENDKSIKELIENVISTEKSEENNEETIGINWKSLEEINKDIIGWIRIQNTNINYPILQDNSNLKYLKHSYNGKYNANGSIFTLTNNPFDEDETTVYGHNMKNKTMFSELDKYMKKDFFNEHSSFYIYTKYQNYKANIFSFYSTNVYEEESNIKALNLSEKIEYYKKKSIYEIKIIDKIEKIIKLSTCSHINNHSTPTNQRYYLIAELKEIN